MLSKLIKSCKPLRCQITKSFVRTSTSNFVKTDEKIKFDSVTTVYDYKSTRELFRGWFVFKLCSYSSLINHLTQLFAISRTILGQRLFEYMMRLTLYEHFVAGTDKNELKPIVERLRQHKVKLILDYSMESDIESKKQSTTGSLELNDYNAKIYDENMLKSIRNVQIATELCGSAAVTAVKITAFVSPDTLQKLNQVIEQKAPKNLSILQIASDTSLMNEQERTQVEHLVRRIYSIIQEAKKNNVRVFMDAEQTYFQTAIHKLVLELQETYNRERIIVYNTYQCYRKTTLDTLRHDLAYAKNKQFHMGIKLVRGAYMDQERKLAADLNITDPIHPNFAATTESYHTAFTEILATAKNNGKNKTHVFVASHNENTVEFALKTMDAMNVKRDDGLVSFATLFGMCDYLTFPLAAVGYDAYKLAPYGPMNSLLPYVTRRAQENRAIFAKAEKDRRLHYAALKQRI